METLHLDSLDLNNHEEEGSRDSSRIILNFSNPVPSASSLPMIIVDNYDGEMLNQENWMGGGILKSKKGAVFHQTRLPDCN